MVILQAAMYILGAGFAGFVAGFAFRYYGIAALSGIVITGMGAWIIRDGLAYRSQCCLHPLTPPAVFPLGALILLIGGLLVLQSFNAFIERSNY